MRLQTFQRILPALLLAWSAALWPALSLAADAGTDQKPAEPYVAVYGGITRAESLKDAESLVSSSVTFSDLDLVDSLIVGIKLGAFQPRRLSWFGLETEFFYTSPHVKEQEIRTFVNGTLASGPSFPPEFQPQSFSGAHIRVAAWALNWLLRYPGERIQPYIGAGPAIFWGRLSGNNPNSNGFFLGTGADTSLGLNALAGIRMLLSERLTVFGEYKYNRVTFDFPGHGANAAFLSVLYQAHHVVGGLALQF